MNVECIKKSFDDVCRENMLRSDICCWEEEMNVDKLECLAIRFCDKAFLGVERLQAKQEVRLLACKYRQFAAVPF